MSDPLHIALLRTALIAQAIENELKRNGSLIAKTKGPDMFVDDAGDPPTGGSGDEGGVGGDGNKVRVRWTADETELAIQLFKEGKTDEEVATYFPGRSVESVKSKRRGEGFYWDGTRMPIPELFPNERSRWSSDDDKKLHQLHAAGYTDIEMAPLLGRRPKSISQRRSKMGLKANREGHHRAVKPIPSIQQELPLGSAPPQPAPLPQTEPAVVVLAPPPIPHVEVLPNQANPTAVLITTRLVKADGRRLEADVPVDMLKEVMRDFMGGA